MRRTQIDSLAFGKGEEAETDGLAQRRLTSNAALTVATFVRNAGLETRSTGALVGVLVRTITDAGPKAAEGAYNRKVGDRAVLLATYPALVVTRLSFVVGIS